MTNEELIHEIKQGNDCQQNMGLLYEQNRNLIYKIALGLISERVELEDLMQEGFIGLKKAVDKFDEGQEVVFLTYAVHWIKAEMVRYMVNNAYVSRIPSSVFWKLTNYKKYVVRYEGEHDGHFPSDQEIMEHLKIDDIELQVLKETNLGTQTETLFKVIYSNDDGELTLQDTIPSGDDLEGEIIERMYSAEVHEAIMKAIDTLTDKRKKVIIDRYFRNRKQDDISQEMDTTKQAVSDLEKRALKSLSQVEYLQMIVEQFGYTSQIAYRGKNPTEKTAILHMEKEQELQKIKKQLKTYTA